VVGIVVAASLAGCTADGDSIARAEGQKVAEVVAERFDDEARGDYQAECLAASTVFAEQSGARYNGPTFEVEAVEWGGTSGSEGGARVVIRISTSVRAVNAPSIGEGGSTAGADISCYEIRVTRVAYDESTPRRVGCPDSPATAQPSAAPEPVALPPETAELLTSVLGASADPEAARASLVDALPTGITIEVSRFEGGLVAALGATQRREFTVAVRRADGTVRVGGGYKPEWLQPGEIGCSTQLVTNPPL
jgi:hypothetical protein